MKSYDSNFVEANRWNEQFYNNNLRPSEPNRSMLPTHTYSNSMQYEEATSNAHTVPTFTSNLTASAREFIPTSSTLQANLVQDNRSKNGAVRKTTYWNNKDNWYRNSNNSQFPSNSKSNEGGFERNRNRNGHNSANRGRNGDRFRPVDASESNRSVNNDQSFGNNVDNNESVSSKSYFNSNKRDYNRGRKNSEHEQEQRTTQKFWNRRENVPPSQDFRNYNNKKVYPRRNDDEVEPSFNNRKVYPRRNEEEMEPSNNSRKSYTRWNEEDNEPSFNNRKIYTRRNEEESEPPFNSKKSYPRRNEEEPEPYFHGHNRRRNEYYDGYKKRNGYNKIESACENRIKSSLESKRISNFEKNLDSASQRERLQQLIQCSQLECLVCCEKLRNTDKTWCCKQCYHILHLQCTKKWANSSKLETGWRCPACQNVYEEVPTKYMCYCNKVTNPAMDPNETPHSCGQVCSRLGRSGCLHKCTLVCHPGPCPDCSVMTSRSCGCGATKPLVKCSSTVPIICGNICGKELTCTFHTCEKKCHEGDCDDCDVDLEQQCYCGKEQRTLKCSEEVKGSKQYECENVCDQVLSCGNHKCERQCHKGLCDPCSLAPENIKQCPCGQTKLAEERKSCLDPIACCDKICSRLLRCGEPNVHQCQVPCHHGPCPPCPLTTMVVCRCSSIEKDLPCSTLEADGIDLRCEKKCTKKRSCGKHKCNQLCCIDMDHVCPLPCNRTLTCGQHKCEQTCHKGHCQPCWHTSFDELYCECGYSVIYPPVSCGTRPPLCKQPCSRPRSCDHDVFHNCHTGPCPPCTILCTRWCYGKHEQRSTIQCHQESFSCGYACGLDMPCGKHKCNQPCHIGTCKSTCSQPCLEPRPLCGHACNLPCHMPPCRESICKQVVTVTCQCGHRKSTRVCNELTAEYQNIAMAQLVSTMEEMQLGRSIDVAASMNKQPQGGAMKVLECTEECRVIERNRRLAIGLQIRNPDLSAKLAPRYSDFMRGWAKRDPKFCQHIHDKLTELVKLAKQSKQKSRSYSFETMNKDKRHFVHEYCEHFGCDSAAYDPEPNRNVVATALKDKSWLPSYSLAEIIQRENGHRKVPGPHQLGKVSTSRSSETVSLKLPGRMPRPSTPPGEYVDYLNPTS